MAIVTKKKKKGFTITELVIVIAVIAILASVMIVSYTSVLSSANETAALEEARSEWTQLQTEVLIGDGATYGDDSTEVTSEDLTDGTFYLADEDETYVFEVVAGVFNTEPVEEYDTTSTYQLSYEQANDAIAVYIVVEEDDTTEESTDTDTEE